MENTSIYIHIPFCHVRCTYCAFNIYTNLSHLIEDYVHALCNELKQVAQKQPNVRIRTIYLGGGTPSLLSHGHIERILQTIQECFPVDQHPEITMECNPEDLQTADYCKGLYQVGINRLSIGAQSANEAELRLFGRPHTIEAIPIAISNCREAGIQNINLDLIFGAPTASLPDWQNSVHDALRQGIQHLSLYGLELEHGTAMTKWVETKKLIEPDDELMAQMYDWATEELNLHGFEQYEISNWARPGFESQHNLQYWWNAPYLGIGAGAHGYANQHRYSVVRSPSKYIRQVSSTHQDNFPYPLSTAVDEYYKVTTADEISETIMMGLRLVKHGINLQEFERRFHVSLLDIRKDPIEAFSNLGLVEVTANALRITSKGRFISNRILRDLI
ncbi:MAG: radical SAM family heme chaperone HemW [Phototrophicaceae bacterium]